MVICFCVTKYKLFGLENNTYIEAWWWQHHAFWLWMLLLSFIIVSYFKVQTP